MFDELDVAREYVALLDQRDPEAVARLVAPGATYSLNGVSLPPGRDAFARRLAAFHEAMPDARVSVTDVVADEERVVIRYQVSGTIAGPLCVPVPEVRSPGEGLSYSVAAFLTIGDGLVVAADSITNLMGPSGRP